MGMALLHEVVMAIDVPLAAKVTIDHPGGNPDLSKHDRQSRGKIFAITLAHLEEKKRERVIASHREAFQAVAVVGSEVSLQGPSFLDLAVYSLGDPSRELSDAG